MDLGVIDQEVVCRGKWMMGEEEEEEEEERGILEVEKLFSLHISIWRSIECESTRVSKGEGEERREEAARENETSVGLGLTVWGNIRRRGDKDEVSLFERLMILGGDRGSAMYFRVLVCCKI